MSTAQPSQMNDFFAGLGGFNTNSPPAPANPYGVQQQQQQQQQQTQEQGSVANGNPYGYQNAQAPSMPVANDNPFAAYSNMQHQQQHQQAMVPVTQPTNQWSMQPQPQQQPLYPNHNMQGGMGYPQQTPSQTMQQPYQQQRLSTPQLQQPQLGRNPSSAHSTAPSIGSSNYMTPNMVPPSPHSQGGSHMMTPGAPAQQSQQQLFAPHTQQQQPYPNYNMQRHQPPQPPQPQQAPPAQLQQPPPAPQQVPPTVDEDEDFFGDFLSTAKKTNEPTTQASPQKYNRPPTEFEVDYNESVSVLSKSTNGTERFSVAHNGSPLDDPRFAPKPPKPQGLDSARALAHNAPLGSTTLPDYDLVTHSGHSLARISFRTILIKKWKPVFWITYGVSKLLVFRSSADFVDWVSNPYLNKAQREFLVKLSIDLQEDIKERTVRGYQVTNQRLKNYNNKMLYQFKIERWMDYGPTIAAAFGSPNEREIFQLRTIFNEMLKRSPQERNLSGNNNQTNAIHNQYSSASGNYPDNASTGRINEQGSMGGKSTKSQGVYSTGPMERTRDPSNQAVAGYQPTSRNGYQY